MKYEYIEKRLAHFWPPAEGESQYGRMFREMSENGWEFCGLLPSVPHRNLEHCEPAVFFFRRDLSALSRPDRNDIENKGGGAA